MRTTRVGLGALLLVASAAVSCHGAILTNGSFVEDFDEFMGTGFVPNPASGQLDSDDWRIAGLSFGNGVFGGVHDRDDFARGTSLGGVGRGGIYSFQVGLMNRALGVQSTSSDFTPGEMTFKLVNRTGQTIASIDVAYRLFVFNDQPRATSFRFAFSSDDFNYTSLPALDFNTPAAADAMPVFVPSSRSALIEGLNLVDGGELYLRWTADDFSGAGGRDELALDDVQLQATFAAARAVPEPATWAIWLLMGVSGAAASCWRRRRSNEQA